MATADTERTSSDRYGGFCCGATDENTKRITMHYERVRGITMPWPNWPQSYGRVNTTSDSPAIPSAKIGD